MQYVISEELRKRIYNANSDSEAVYPNGFREIISTVTDTIAIGVMQHTLTTTNRCHRA